jgi:hypothetical protein
MDHDLLILVVKECDRQVKDRRSVLNNRYRSPLQRLPDGSENAALRRAVNSVCNQGGGLGCDHCWINLDDVFNEVLKRLLPDGRFAVVTVQFGKQSFQNPVTDRRGRGGELGCDFSRRIVLLEVRGDTGGEFVGDILWEVINVVERVAESIGEVTVRVVLVDRGDVGSLRGFVFLKLHRDKSFPDRSSRVSPQQRQ